MRTQKHSTATKKLYAQVLKALRAVIEEEESSRKVYGDDTLTERIRARGVFTTRTMTRDVRVEAGIPTARERKAQHFAREFKNAR